MDLEAGEGGEGRPTVPASQASAERVDHLRALMRRLLAALLFTVLWAAPAHGAAYLPPAGKTWHGLTGGNTVDEFTQQTGKAPAIFQLFVTWNEADWAFRRAEQQDGRLMLHLSTSNGPGTRERITPAQIARGDGDAFLDALNERIREHGEPVYLRSWPR
jgi:hypothetical protein